MREIVTTSTMQALPITTPNIVKKALTLLARSASIAIRQISPWWGISYGQRAAIPAPCYGTDSRSVAGHSRRMYGVMIRPAADRYVVKRELRRDKSPAGGRWR